MLSTTPGDVRACQVLPDGPVGAETHDVVRGGRFRQPAVRRNIGIDE
jgi:hypothetical protein